MILFILSLILVSVSSYLLSAILENKDPAKGFIYSVILAFSQVILFAEILSPFKSFKELPFLALNFITFILITIIWQRSGKPCWKPEFKNFLTRFKNALFLDKSLIILFLAWGFFIFVAIFLCFISPVTNGDAKSYHVVRSAYWVLNSSINHFDTANIRNLIFPINSEIIYAWIILFTKKAFLLGFVSLISYFVYLTSLYQVIHKTLGYSLRKTLWVIFIVSSFAGVISYVSSTQTDLIIATLVLTSIYLFLDSFTQKNNVSVFMSSLCLALALGVKSSAFFLFPAVGLFFIFLAVKNKKLKTLLLFLGFGALNFILISAYNYVLNFMQFNNPLGFEGAIIAHKNIYGIKGCLASLVRHFFLLFDFTGFNLSAIWAVNILNFKMFLLNSLGLAQIPEGIYSLTESTGVNNTLSEVLVGCGVLGFVLYLPCLFISIVMPIFKRDKKTILNFCFSFIFVISFVTMSAYLVYMIFNVRFLNSFVLVSAPVLSYSYIKSNKNIFKWFIIFIACFYLTCVSTHLWARPFYKIFSEIITNRAKISDVQYTMDCLNWDTKEVNYDKMCQLEALIDYNFNDKNNKILFFADSSAMTLRFVLKNINGANFDIKLIEDLDKINIDDYNILILPKHHQDITFIEKYSPEKIKYDVIHRKNGSIEINFDNPNDEYVCMYTGIDKKILTRDSKEIPYNEFCNFSANFLAGYKLEPVMEIEKYIFFVNKRNLPRTEKIRQFGL